MFRALPVLLLLLTGMTLPVTGATSDGVAIEELVIEQPRAFGFQLGDQFERRLHLRLRHPYELVADSLPTPGRLNRWIAFHSHDVKARAGRNADDLLITLRYQVVNVEPTVTDAGVPSHKLRITDGKETLTFQVPPVRTVITPFAEAVTTELAPDIAPARLPIDYRLASVLGAVCIGSLLAFAWFEAGGFGRRSRRPFRQAHRQLRRLRHDAAADDAYADALRCIHEAFNLTAGHTLFPERLDEFIDRHPAFAALHDDIVDYFKQSNEYFFENRVERRPLDELISFARRCRDVEQGLA